MSILFLAFQAFFERFNYRLTEVEYASVLKAGFRPCRIRNLANKSVYAAGFALPEQKSAQTKPSFTRQQKFLINYRFLKCRLAGENQREQSEKCRKEALTGDMGSVPSVFVNKPMSD
ncbi:MAG: hypothetical protein SOX69_08215 [Oscillospiraceae bacterium]|nr:hypothetical protein [Oscillospiraceae bacterium]